MTPDTQNFQILIKILLIDILTRYKKFGIRFLVIRYTYVLYWKSSTARIFF